MRSLPIASVIGEALAFGAARFGVIARAAWLPIALLIVVNFATLFALLSVIADKPVTLSDVGSVLQANQFLAQGAEKGWSERPWGMAGVIAASALAQILLVSSFLAPLIRYAATGERPRPRLFSLPFGPDQARLIAAGVINAVVIGALAIAPVALASFFVMRTLTGAMNRVVADFPDRDSLHSVDLARAHEAWAAGAPAPDALFGGAGALTFAFFAASLLIAIAHFVGDERARREGALSAAIGVGALLVLLFAIGGAAMAAVGAALGDPFAGAQGAVPDRARRALQGLAVAAGPILIYLGLRLYPLPGAAIGARRMVAPQLLALSRGWNIFRLLIIVAATQALLIGAQLAINVIALPWTLQTVNTIYAATEASFRLVSDGAGAGWVQPAFAGLFRAIQISANFGWAIFVYGVTAGLQGRLFREGVKMRAAR